MEVIATIYQLVKEAGKFATRRILKEAQQNKVCIMMPYEKGINRVSATCLETTKYSAVYDPNHLTIMGGAAFNLYDYKVTNLKKRRSLSELKEYIKKRTSDIDINWWPVVTTRNNVMVKDMIVVAASPSISTLKDYFMMELIRIFDQHADQLLELIRPYLPGSNVAYQLKTSIYHFFTPKAGVYNIGINFIVKNYILKMCDINIHDSGASQRYDKNGEEITDLRPMTDDPTYSSPDPSNPYSISYLTVGEYDIAVPNIIGLVDQQLFAFSNLIRQDNMKYIVNYRRVLFIYRVLSSVHLHDPNNRENIQELLDIFQTTNSEYVTNLLHDIDQRVNETIEKNMKQIMDKCMELHGQSDSSLSDLCDRANQIMEQYRAKQAKLYHDLHQIVTKKRTDASSVPYKKQYVSLQKQIDVKYHQIVNTMSTSDLLNYKAKHALNEYISFVDKLESINKDYQKYYHARMHNREQMLRKMYPSAASFPNSP